MDNNIDDYEGGSNIVDVWPRYLAPLDRYVSTNWRTNNYHYSGDEDDRKRFWWSCVFIEYFKLIKENNKAPKSETPWTRDSDIIKNGTKVLMVWKCLRNILDVLRKTKETLNGAGWRHRSGFQESTAARLYIHWKGHSMFSIAADNGKTSKLANKKKKIMFNFYFYHRRHDHHCAECNLNHQKSI